MYFSSKRLLWSEGTMLAQQHFQQWDFLQKSRDQFWYHFNKKRPREGFLSLEIDESVLEFGTFRLNRFQAISHEGQVLAFRSNQNSVTSLELNLNAIEYLEAPRQGDVLIVYIAVPKGSNSHGVSGYPRRDILTTRWIAEYSSCVDEMDENRQQEILFGHLNVQLLVHSSIEFAKRKSENDLLVVAKIMYSGVGRYTLKPEFVPPILRLCASGWLMGELKNLGLYLKFIEKSLMLKIKNMKTIGYCFHEWRSRELLNIVSLLRYRINIWIDNPNVDPDDILDTIMQSIIMTRSFSTYIDVTETILSGNAGDLYETFSAVFCSLKDIIQNALPMKQKNISLIDGADAWLSSEFLDEETVETADLYLSVSFDNDTSWIDRFMKEVKLSGVNDIKRIITQALQGLAVLYCPEKLNFFVDDKKRSYFKINKVGPYWDDVRDSGKLCIFISKWFLGFDIKLIALFERDGRD